MDELMEKAKYDKSQITDIVKVDGKSVMFPLASFVYPVFVNLDISKAAGVDKLPTTRTEFAEAAKKMTDASKNQYGWVLPLSLQSPSGIQNDVMSWVWASGASMLKDGKPDLENDAVVGTLDYLASLNKEGVISPGIFAKKEQDKVEEFVNGRVGMMQKTVKTIRLFEQKSFDPLMQEMGKTIVQAAHLIAEALPLLDRISTNAPRLAALAEEVTRVEGRSDELHEQGLKDLFRRHGASNAMAYLIGSEIYGELEKVVDRFEDVANEISGIVIENV